MFAVAARLRREIGAKMSSNDREEYERYLDLVHEKLDHTTFESEYTEGFSMTTDQIIDNLKEWSFSFNANSLPETTVLPRIQFASLSAARYSKSYIPM